MGLGINVGVVVDLAKHDEEGAAYYRETFKRLNAWLASQGLAPHHEPEKLPTGGYTCDFFYSMIHSLRRVAAHLVLKQSLPEPGDRKAAASDPVLERFYLDYIEGGSPYDHLMFHSDAEGLYLPQAFGEVLDPPEELEIPGGSIGSSVALLRECERLAAALSIPADLDPESSELFDYMEEEKAPHLTWQRYPTETYVCLHLSNACRASIASGAAIVFS